MGKKVNADARGQTSASIWVKFTRRGPSGAVNFTRRPKQAPQNLEWPGLFQNPAGLESASATDKMAGAVVASRNF
jgi:hypothetical protein